MSNLEKAILSFCGYTTAREEMELEIETEKVFELLKLAAEPDWIYDSLPNDCEKINVVFKNFINVTYPGFYSSYYKKYIIDDIEYSPEEILCWCKLPIYKKT